MKALVTGGTGFIGSHLARALRIAGHDVTVTSRSKTINAFRQNLLAGIPLDCRDLEDPIACTELVSQGWDWIFHLAASASVPNSVRNPKKDFGQGVLITLNLLESIRESKSRPRLVFSSTVSVVDRDSPKPILEDSPIRPSSPYGASKSCCEAYINAYTRTYGLDLIIGRLFNVYGPGVDGLFIYDIVKKLLNTETQLDLWGDGKQIRDYLHVDDVVKAFILLAEKGIAGSTYNICSSIPVSIIELVEKIKINLKKTHVQNRFVTNYSGDIPIWYGSNIKIANLGFKAEMRLDVGLLKTVDYCVSDLRIRGNIRE